VIFQAGVEKGVRSKNVRDDLGWLGVFKADKLLPHLDFIISLSSSFSRIAICFLQVLFLALIDSLQAKILKTSLSQSLLATALVPTYVAP